VKAAVCDTSGGGGIPRAVDRPAPSPGLHELAVSVRAAGLNRADLLQCRGLYPPPPGATDILGLECAGEVAELGAGVDDLAVGDRVMALLPGGGQSERAIAHRGSVLRVPDVLSDDEAGGFPEVVLTAFLNLFVLGRLDPGAAALVHGGSGGVGTAAIALATEAGARVAVTAGTGDRCRRCRELGAEVAVNYRTDDFVEAARALTDGRGVDVVLDCVGGEYLDRNLRALAPDGRLVVIGLMGGRNGELHLARLLTRRLQVIGSTLRALDVDRKAEVVRAFLDRFGDALDAGRLRPIIDSVHPLERVADAHRRLASGDAFGKVVLRVAS
jgi:putative PIG3 family NAD(P)H quinone oxidoreductase